MFLSLNLGEVCVDSLLADREEQDEDWEFQEDEELGEDMDELLLRLELNDSELEELHELDMLLDDELFDSELLEDAMGSCLYKINLLRCY